MSISPPHGPVHEEIEFWYDPNEKALLYGNIIQRGTGEAIPDHSKWDERWHSTDKLWREHRPVHFQPHGISFKDAAARCGHGEANIANAELVVRLWCQVKDNEQPVKSGPKEPLIPVPKALALFLSAKRTDMYRQESLTQAIVLLHSYIAAKGPRQVAPS